MRFLIGFGLMSLLFLLSGCSNQSSPRMESIRPHLKAGATEADLEKAVGHWQADLGPDQAGNQRRLVYSLDGKDRDRKLELRFRDDKLVSAVVLEADPQQEKKPFTKVVEEVLKPVK
jgi:hypothetical protein